jgi:dethiobiotin synthetase
VSAPGSGPGAQRLVFVTGTDTGVGKTFVTAALAAALRTRGVAVAALKPVETGVDGVGPTDAERLAAAAAPPLAGPAARSAAAPAEGPTDVAPPSPWYCFTPALSPHLAARQAGVAIDAPRLAAAIRAVARTVTVTLVEGAGGLLVPLNDDGRTMADLCAALDADLLVVARASLGTINHTLLTLAEARRRALRVLGVVVNDARPRNGPPATPDPSAAFNAQEIARFGGCPVWGPLAWCFGGGDAPPAAARWLSAGAPSLVHALAAGQAVA